MKFVLSWYVFVCLLNDSFTGYIKQKEESKGLAGFFFVTFFSVLYAHISFYMHFRFFFSLFQESFDSSKPITADDVHQVFDNLAKKRRRVE